MAIPAQTKTLGHIFSYTHRADRQKLAAVGLGVSLSEWDTSMALRQQCRQHPVKSAYV